jgi:hypothetical protein
MDDIVTVQHHIGAVGTLSPARLPAVRPYGKDRTDRRRILLNFIGDAPLP